MLFKRVIKKYFSLNPFPYMNGIEYRDLQERKYIKFMKPEEYITEASKILGLPISQVIHSRVNDTHSYGWITAAANKKELTIPMLDYVNGKQDGLHRVIWAKKRKLKKVPVFVYK